MKWIRIVMLYPEAFGVQDFVCHHLIIGRQEFIVIETGDLLRLVYGPCNEGQIPHTDPAVQGVGDLYDRSLPHTI